jgi:hypothetical protein
MLRAPRRNAGSLKGPAQQLEWVTTSSEVTMTCRANECGSIRRAVADVVPQFLMPMIRVVVVAAAVLVAMAWSILAVAQEGTSPGPRGHRYRQRKGAPWSDR